MRICRISRTYPRDISAGSGLVAFNLAKHIPAETLFIAKRFPGRYVDPPPNVRLVIIPYWEPSVPQTLGRLTAIWIMLGKALGSLWFLLRAAPIMIRFRPDIVHVHTILPILLGIFAKIFLGTPLVVQFHGTDFVRFRHSKLLQSLVNRWVDTVLCVSHRMQDEMTTLVWKPNVLFIPTGVDLDQFQNRHIPRAKQIAAVGMLKWQKGYEYLLQAMGTIVQREPDTKLCIAGSGSLENELREMVTSLGLERNVEFLGALSHDEVAHLLNSSLVFVLSSVSEGLPKVLLEALACGTPLVVTDVGECAAVVDGAGYVVPPKSPQALAEAVLRLLTDTSEWHRFSERAWECAQRYSWDEAASKTVAVYRELLGVQLASSSNRRLEKINS